jgi:hypothetical protein
MLFTDIRAYVHSLMKKGPIVTTDHLNADSAYPQSALIGCQTLQKNKNIVTIDLSNH